MFLDNDMATNIVRWMKTKFHGYKAFTVMPNELNESRLSDTELLLKPSNFMSEESFSCDAQRQHQHQSVQHLHRRRHHERDLPSVLPSKDEKTTGCVTGKRPLNFEELECDFSVEGCGTDEIDGQRQEFSFTLYDLDGHGKITKDDITSLVKTIYETLGQSIKVPHYGSKTIKVKLTVSPEKSFKGSNETSSPTSTSKTQYIPGCTPNNNNNDHIIGGSSNNNNTTKRNTDLHSSKIRERRCRQEQILRRRRHSISSSGLSEDREADVSEDDDDEVPLNNKIRNPALINAGPTTIFSKYKKRSSSLQRQELFEIIQANMEKNNLSFQTSRKPSANNMVFTSQCRRRTKSQPFTRQFVNSWETSMQPDKCGKMFLNSVELKTASDAKRIHQIPSSFDSPSNKENKKQPTSHELKHRYREFEQARAKEQVVRWLEQEFSSPTKYCNRKNNNYLNNKKCTSKEEVKSKSRSYSNEKHEHHHIHEHVHHHYHHYHESPVVV